ncbi:hypothetical protein D3C85_1796620 [compost metagenome]
MLVGAQIVEPDSLGMDLAVFRFSIEKYHVRFHALRVEDARRQAQNRVHIAGFQQLPTNPLPSAAFK